MERPFWKHEQEVDQAQDIVIDEVIDHAKMLFSNASFLCFAHGNIDQKQVKYPFYEFGSFFCTYVIL